VQCPLAIIHFQTKKQNEHGKEQKDINHDIEQINHIRCKLIYFPKLNSADRPVVLSSQEEFSIFREKWDDSNIHVVEEFKLMLLNRSNRVQELFQ
jgi:hypothetical protein